MTRASGTRTAPAQQVGWCLLHCVRIDQSDYVGLIRRTRKDRIGYWDDYAVVRSEDRRDLEAGDLWFLSAVRLERAASNRAVLGLTDREAWTTSTDKAYAKFQSVIVAGRKTNAGGRHRRRANSVPVTPKEVKAALSGRTKRANHRDVAGDPNAYA
jgi:hypothetical protein